ncbi:MAG: hypothetical protein HZA01_01260 [Nitrospinae bacterium]|nr:hypothetical protein [Nitrospinota bacterium]
MRFRITALSCLFFFLLVSIHGYAEEPIEKRLDRMDLKLEKLDKIETQVLENRERLIRLEARMEEGFKGVDMRFASMDMRFSDMNQRITDMNNLTYVVLGGIIALIGFVIWDRRTAVAPVARKNRELEEREDLLEKALREYAKKEPKLAEVLRNAGLF